jgi:hypothetical protein
MEVTIRVSPEASLIDAHGWRWLKRQRLHVKAKNPPIPRRALYGHPPVVLLCKFGTIFDKIKTLLLVSSEQTR